MIVCVDNKRKYLPILSNVLPLVNKLIIFLSNEVKQQCYSKIILSIVATASY